METLYNINLSFKKIKYLKYKNDTIQVIRFQDLILKKSYLILNALTL